MNQIMKSYVQPTPGDVHVNRPLTNLSVAYMQSRDDFVARNAFPIIPVAKQSDLFWVYDRGTFNRDSMEKRAPGAPTAGITHTLSNTPYFCDVWGLHEDIADQVRANQDDQLSMEQDAVELISRAGLIRQEREFVTKAFQTSAWTSSLNGATSRATSFDPTSGTAGNRNVVHWDDEASTPIEDIRLLKRTVQERTGFRPNVLTIGRAVYDALLDHTDIIGRIDSGQTPGGPAMTTQNTIAALFELEAIYVMDAIYNTAAEGLSTSTSFIAGKNGLLHYRPSSPGLRVPSAGYTFVWTGYAGAPENGARMKRFRMEEIASDRIEGELAFSEQVVGTDLGSYLNGIVS